MEYTYERLKTAIQFANTHADVEYTVREAWPLFEKNPDALRAVLLEATKNGDRDFVGYAVGHYAPTAPLFAKINPYVKDEALIETLVCSADPLVNAPLTREAIVRQRTARALTSGEGPQVFRPEITNLVGDDGSVREAPLKFINVAVTLVIAKGPVYPGDAFILTLQQLAERADIRQSPYFGTLCASAAMLGIPPLVQLCVDRARDHADAMLSLVEAVRRDSMLVIAREFARLAGVRGFGDTADTVGFVLWTRLLADMYVRGKAEKVSARVMEWIEMEQSVARRAAAVEGEKELVDMLMYGASMDERHEVEDVMRFMAVNRRAGKPPKSILEVI